MNGALRWLLCSASCLYFGALACAQKRPLFTLLPSSQTGITFRNTITENDTLNILNQANIYNGGGVGIGDFNNDGLQDIYFAGNQAGNKLYLNKGSLKFEDVTTASNTGGEGRWCTGVSVVDINNDGWMDIYMAASFSKDPKVRTNLLYINEGVNKDGIPAFKESAAAYGLADTGFSTQGYFFDYDRDGDLDLYLVTNALYDPKTPIRFRPKVRDGSALNTDRLYRNNGNGTFTNVSKGAGILMEGWGHAACVSDFNHDGWPDVYVANDFVSNDLLYINNRDGTFTDKLSDYFKHTAWNAMGSDAVDMNNDGYPDLISLEMLPEDNGRKKRMLSGNEYYNYFNAAQYGYTHQYVRNVLQLNSGPTPLGHPVFSDIGFMAGLYQTDWSWCPLAADFDNDGWRDLIISNGLPRDVTDLDYIAYDNGQGGGAANLSLAKAATLPVVHIPNYAFKNSNGLQFQNVTADWGLSQSSFSNGSAYADLDNDGDLDFVVNNINGEAFVYENHLNKRGQTPAVNWLTIKLQGSKTNRGGIGVSLTVFFNGKKIYYEQQPCRGYLSTVDDRAHFGLGEASVVDSVLMQWPDGKSQRLLNVKANGTVTLPGSYGRNRPVDIFAGLQLANGSIVSGASLGQIGANNSPAPGVKLIGSDGPINGVDYNAQSGFYIRKFVDPAVGAGSRGTGSEVPWIRYRYAEVLLNAAEAAFELGNTAEAAGYLNQVRTRAGFTTPLAAGQLTFDRIVNERRVELAFEGHYLYDRKRWRIAHIVLDGVPMTETDLLSNIGSATKRNTQAYSLWPYKVYNPGGANNNKWFFRIQRNANVTGANRFALGNYYSAIDAGLLANNPKLVKQPNQ